METAGRGRGWSLAEQFGAKGHGFDAYDRPYAYGDGPLARLDPRTLPEDRKALARVLTTGIRKDRWGSYASSRGHPSAPHRVETVIETGWARHVGERP